ncbi:hypothetical protein [Alicyclobacillus herbarius]|uniref:hypothetical protein n=1 Tax=Alicyclobacillus herbarius TaxID=122960 RepID=UPI000479DC59|nr:hypothetical protein [Alicyclobacillus herbarius]
MNVIEHPALCTLTAPASTRRGPLQMAISASGTDPAEAARLHHILEQDLEQGTSPFQKELLKFHVKR